MTVSLSDHKVGDLVKMDLSQLPHFISCVEITHRKSLSSEIGVCEVITVEAQDFEPKMEEYLSSIIERGDQKAIDAAKDYIKRIKSVQWLVVKDTKSNLTYKNIPGSWAVSYEIS